ncbi:hypothetical protein [Pontixanthobacter sp.]|uniref:hypothetical protein n=1 Tax=Pontixanthobacter sp. TaxID=2792078 RepID=UPI003C7B5D7F
MQIRLEEGARTLAFVGALLFLAGLLQGLVVQQFANPRMALSAHLDAVQSGMAVMIAAVFWSACKWAPFTEKIARWALSAGMVGLWLGITLAAMTGASEALPIAGAGHSASPPLELASSAVIISSSVLVLAGWLMFVIGLIRGR